MLSILDLAFESLEKYLLIVTVTSENSRQPMIRKIWKIEFTSESCKRCTDGLHYREDTRADIIQLMVGHPLQMFVALGDIFIVEQNQYDFPSILCNGKKIVDSV